MSVDPSVLAALTVAVSGDPDNLPVRTHLASLLIQADQCAEALEHCAYVLARQPDNLEALSHASQAAEALGDSAKAAGYRRLYEALSWDRAKSMVEGIETSPFPEEHNQPTNERPREAIRLGREPFEESDEDRWETELPTISLQDVAGMEEVKRRLNLAFLAPMRNPEMMAVYGKSLRGGLLLYGPPGCGKTYIARATAGELQAKFMAIGLTDVVDMWIGESEKNLHEIFETARRSRPCVLFFDEIDALGRKRSLMRESAGRTVVNQLLAELDSVGSDNEGLFVLAATNHPWDVDTALRRPGRLDRTLLVLPPDPAAREAILRFHLKNRPTEGIDVKRLAAQTEGFSGADVVHLCESAVESAMEESLTTGRIRKIEMNDFKRALKEVKPSVRTWFDTARNYAMFANEGGAYDDLLAYLRTQKMV